MKRRTLVLIGAPLIAIGLVAGGLSIASADVPDSGGSFHFCYQTSIPTHGTNMVLIDPDNGGSCSGGMSEATINAPQETEGVLTLNSGSPQTCSLSNVTGPEAGSISTSLVVNGECQITGFPSDSVVVANEEGGSLQNSTFANAGSGTWNFTFATANSGGSFTFIESPSS